MSIDPALDARWDRLHEELLALAVSHPLHDQGEGPPCRQCTEAKRIGRQLDEATHEIKRRLRQMQAQQTRETTMLEGTLSQVVFLRDGFFIGKITTDRAQRETVKGQCSAPKIGARYTFTGGYVVDERFGPTFVFTSYSVALPTDADGVVSYLISTAKWIGASLARAVVDAYGPFALDTLKTDPHRVAADIRGITLERAIEIQAALNAHEAQEKTVIGLAGLFKNTEIPNATIDRAIDRWGYEAAAVVEADPFALVNLHGIGFKMADRVRQNLGILPDDHQRIAAGIEFILDDASWGQGHTYLTDVAFTAEAAKVLYLTMDQIEPSLDVMVKQGRIVRHETTWLDVTGYNLALPELEFAERRIASKIAKMAAMPLVAGKIKPSVQEGLAQDQVDALEAFRTSRVFVLTGAPGTGKTHLVRRLLDVLLDEGAKHVKLCAPTGKAAKRLTELVGREATTIHRLLEPSISEGKFKFARDDGNQIEADAVIVDESSMIDVPLMDSLMAAVPTSARLVLVGDTNQLPSVGPGNVLRDVIASGVAPVSELRTIKRQGEGNIVRHCHRIRDGMALGDVVAQNLESPDFYFAQEPNAEEALEELVSLASERLPARFNVDPVRDIQVLAPMRDKGPLSCRSINERLRQALNPRRPEVGARFAVGDKVIQLRNDYERGIYNGDIGQVAASVRDRSQYVVKFDAPLREVEIPWKDCDLELAYAVTIHKSQGSEWPVVVIPVHPMAGNHMWQRNLLYTAISRAKKVCLCVGDQGELPKIIKRTSQARRNTNLAAFLREAING